MAAVVRNMAAVPVAVRVRVGGLRRGAGVLRRSQGLLAGRGVGVAGGHHGRGHGLLGRGKDLREEEPQVNMENRHPAPPPPQLT